MTGFWTVVWLVLGFLLALLDLPAQAHFLSLAPLSSPEAGSTQSVSLGARSIQNVPSEAGSIQRILGTEADSPSSRTSGLKFRLNDALNEIRHQLDACSRSA